MQVCDALIRTGNGIREADARLIVLLQSDVAYEEEVGREGNGICEADGDRSTRDNEERRREDDAFREGTPSSKTVTCRITLSTSRRNIASFSRKSRPEAESIRKKSTM